MQFKISVTRFTGGSGLLALLLVLACSHPQSAAAARADSLPDTARVVVWDGEANDRGSTWVNPTTSTFVRTQDDAHSGKTALALKFHDKNAWIGSGFDWFDWKAGRDIGTDTSRMTTLNFWIKAKGTIGDFQLQLLCNGDVIDTPEHHAPKVSVAKYCPNFRDGQWHEVVIPLRDMPYPPGYDPKVVTMIDFGFWADGDAEGSILIDDLAFDSRKVEATPAASATASEPAPTTAVPATPAASSATATGLASALMSPGGDNSNGVPAALLGRLTTGLNVSRWFCYVKPGDQTEHFANYLTDADYQNFQRIGVGFVRLCISPDVIYGGGKPTDNLPAIDHALDELTRRHIAVIWDLHDNGQLGLDKANQDNSGLESFWTAVAAHYKGSHYSDLVFEIVNEPVFLQKPEDWYALQARIVGAIRKTDPDRTIIVSPTYWSSIDTLLKMPALPVANLIYTIHCYDPFFFTHQGAEWVGETPKNFSSLPFPSSPEAVEAILSKNDPKYAENLKDYGKQRYDAAYILSRLKLATDWGAVHHVPILLGEFGAYPKASPPDSRARWFDGMRSAIATLHLPNSIWGYDDGFGLGRNINQDGLIWLDPITLGHFYGVRP